MSSEIICKCNLRCEGYNLKEDSLSSRALTKAKVKDFIHGNDVTYSTKALSSNPCSWA